MQVPAESPVPEPTPRAERGPRWSQSLGLLIFGFGTAAGFMLAFTGLGVLEEWVGIFLLISLALLMFISAFGLILYLFRKTLMRRLFGMAEAQLEHFSGPLAEVARGAVDRDPHRATDAARDLINMGLARYAWISTRRWIIGSLTALIAAMAALAGTAMLFRQNELLEEQTMRIDRQIVLADQAVQLAEASRNAGLVAAIVDIGDALGQVLGEKQAAPDGRKRTAEDLVAVIDPLEDLGLGLITRIISASKATKPYRYLDYPVQENDTEQMFSYAAAERQDELPRVWENVPPEQRAAILATSPRLIDRPQSPERGQLFFTLAVAGVREFSYLNHFQMNLAFADARGIQLFLVSFQNGMLRFADLSFAELREVDFGGAFLENVRFRKAQIFNSSFAAVAGSEVDPPYPKDEPFYTTSMAGADFSDALLVEVSFAGVNGALMNFGQAALMAPDFSGAIINGTSFREAALLDPNFTGADLGLVDLDGALVAGADFLEATAAAAARFKQKIYSLEKATMDDLLSVPGIALSPYGPSEMEVLIKDRGIFRVIRNGNLRD